jgi:hypothetical protein
MLRGGFSALAQTQKALQKQHKLTRPEKPTMVLIMEMINCTLKIKMMIGGTRGRKLYQAGGIVCGIRKRFAFKHKMFYSLMTC